MVNSGKLHWICSVPIGAPLATLGVIGNIVSILIWNRITKTKTRGNQSTALYFIALSVCDGGLLISFLFMDTLSSNNPELKQNYHYAAAFAWVLFPMFFFTLVASIWMVVGVTINRYVMIAFPTRVNALYTRFRSLLGIFGIVVFAFCVNLPHFFTYHVAETNGTYQLSMTKFGHSDASIKYEFWAHCIVLVLVPWFTIAVLNGMIIYRLHQQMQKFTTIAAGDSKKSKQQRREQQMTKMLLAVTFSFLVLLAWQCITQCFWMLQYGKHDEDKSKWIMVDTSFALAKMGVIINSSINWCLYCITSSLFRKQMRKLFGIKTRRLSSSGRYFESSSMGSTTKSSSLNSRAPILVDNTKL